MCVDTRFFRNNKRPPFFCINSLGRRTVFEGVDDQTVVFVLGDHGMTEDGNHGGATPEETGAALLVWSRSGERLLGPGFSNRRNSGGASSSGRDKNSGGTGGASSETLPGADGGSTDRRQGGPAQGHGDVAPGEEEGSEEDHSGPVPSGRRVAQIDLVPTISLLLGTPIPFGSLGGVIPEVFGGPYLDGGGSGDDERGPRYLERLCDALLVNSVQVGGGCYEWDGTCVVLMSLCRLVWDGIARRRVMYRKGDVSCLEASLNS